MNARGLTLVLALVSLGFGACGGGAGGDEIPEGQTLVVVTVTLADGLPEVRQIQVHAHNGAAGDVDLYFPTMVGGPIASGATLGILVPKTIMVPNMITLLDLVLRGLTDSLPAGIPVARGSGQAMITPGATRVQTTILLEACGTSGTSGC